LGDFIELFETAAFSVDSQEVLGVITWGFVVKDDSTSPIILLFATGNDASLKPSTTFTDLIQRANGPPNSKGLDGQVMTYARFDPNTGKIASQITAPNTTKVNCGGVSALP
jgi:hypothetical protein